MATENQTLAPTEAARIGYLVLLSIHGLIRGQELELGRDADTGGQTKYVLDLAKALADLPTVSQVDLVTRRIVDPAVAADYAEPVEVINDKLRIVRIDAGPGVYLPKEQLWDHLDSFTDNLLFWLRSQGLVPDVIHSHYADAGYVGVRASKLLGIPLVHTGHSLGRDKRKRLLASGMNRSRIEERYSMARRIDAEEETLANASLVIASTRNEIEAQYSLYQYYDAEPMLVIPPGTDLNQFHPAQPGENNPVASAVHRFLSAPEKPLILALSRADERKNIRSLIEAYGRSAVLQQHANLLIVAGNRQDIREMERGAKEVLTEILRLIDAHDLYGKVAFPKTHTADEVPAFYQLAAAQGGVFINPALTEPFGLTLLEAAACGLPVVATENGGPVDILESCQNGLLVDPLDVEAMAQALIRLLQDKRLWQEAASNGLRGVREHYAWTAHAREYVKRLQHLLSTFQPQAHRYVPRDLQHYRSRAIFTDLDQNLIGDAPALRQFLAFIRQHRSRVTFGIATGRRLDSAIALMKKHGIPAPDVLISSSGTQIHYGAALDEDSYWSQHIDHNWNRAAVQRVLQDIPGLSLQPAHEQSAFKISFYWDAQRAPTAEALIERLRAEEITANLISSFGQFLDVVPARASKGMALRYVADLLNIPLQNILAAGGSGADEDMMRGNTLAVVVANRHHEELSSLTDLEQIYFATQPYALGILEAVQHYRFLKDQPRGDAA